MLEDLPQHRPAADARPKAARHPWRDRFAAERPGALAGSREESCCHPLGSLPAVSGADHLRKLFGFVGAVEGVGDQRVEIGDHAAGHGFLAACGVEVGERLGAEQDADPGGPGAREQPDDRIGFDRAELINQRNGRDRVALVLLSDRDQVEYDRGGDLARQERVVVGLQPEQGDGLEVDGLGEAQDRRICPGGIEPGGQIGARQRGDTVPQPCEIRPLAPGAP